MDFQVIQQPDGNYCVFSTDVDDFIMVDYTRQALIDFYMANEGHTVRDHVVEVLAKLGDGEKPYNQSTQTFLEALKTRNSVHNNRFDYISRAWVTRQLGFLGLRFENGFVDLHPE